MHAIKISLLSAGLFVSSLSAQSGPGQLTTAARDAYLTNAKGTANKPTIADVKLPAPLWPAGAGTFSQVHATKSGLAGLKPGQFALTFTTSRLNPFYHTRLAPASGVILGKYDVTGKNPVFTPTTLAKNMNAATGTVFGLMVEPRDGLYAAVDWTAGPQLSLRASKTAAFPAPVQIGPGTLGTFIDPAAAYVDGKLTLFYTDGTSIIAAPLTTKITNGKLVSATAVAGRAVATIGGLIMHSPSPVIDARGNAQGLFLAGLGGNNDSDTYFHGSLNNRDVPIKMFDNSNWQNNGGFIGGTFLFSNTASSASLWRIDAAYVIGSRSAVGTGTATITVYAPSGTPPVVSGRIALATNLAPPFAIPGWAGHLGIGGVILPFAGTSATDKDERGSWSLAVPNTPALKGQRVPIQALSGAIGLRPALTNTAYLEFF